MKIINKFENPNDITIESYLKAYGIDDVAEFLNPKGRYLDNPMDYVNIDYGIELLSRDYSKVYLIQDSDVDGIMSSALAYMFLRHLGIDKENIVVLFHDGKQHGLSKHIMQEIRNNNDCQFLWICDAASNDVSQCDELQDMGIDILITDHHKSKANPYATVINNQLSPKIKNKDLCGTGVTFQLIRAYCDKHNDSWYHDKLDLVAVANVADVMSMTNQENRWINYWGLDYITNPFLKDMCKEFIRGDIRTPKDVAFSIAPKLNALCRSDNQELKEKIFYAICGELECDDELIKELRRCHDKQSRDVKSMYEELIEKEPYVVNNIAIYRVDSTPYTGLVATKISDHFGMPAILLHESKDIYSGSCRSPLMLRNYIDSSGAVKFAQGHDKAFGLAIWKNKVWDFIDYLKENPIDITPTKNVTCSVNNIIEIPNILYKLGSNYNELWGTELPEPTVYIKNITINSKDIKELKGNTIKFKVGTVDFIKFACSNEFKEKLKVGKSENITMNIIGCPSLNEWNGNISQQMFIEEIEII